MLNNKLLKKVTIMEEHLYRVKYLESGFTESFDLDCYSKVILNDVMFGTGIVTKITLRKYLLLDGTEPVFVEIYRKDKEIAAVLAEDNYLIKIEAGCITSYVIRKATKNDFSSS